jgi:uncharacterized cofD-like protein
MENVKIVVIGGGTGSFTLLSGLKKYFKDLTALVTMADDGGSTGVLRDELGVLPPGDVRQCLVALSDSLKVRDLFNYRFDEGSFEGHSFGNLFLSALEKQTGSFAEGVKTAEELLNIQGRVLPITLDDVVLSMRDGIKKTTGESTISKTSFSKKRPKIWLETRWGKEPKLNPEAKEAINRADIIVIAPGNIYSSLAPSLTMRGVGEALSKSKAKKVYITNLMTKPGQTDGFSVQDFAHELERLAGTKFLTHILYNTNQPGKNLLKKYAQDKELPVEFDQSARKKLRYRLIGADLLADKIWHNPNKRDPIKRTLIRHDPNKVAWEIMRIFFMG